eukprot:6468159-Amphidinium_carterae.2
MGCCLAALAKQAQTPESLSYTDTSIELMLLVFLFQISSPNESISGRLSLHILGLEGSAKTVFQYILHNFPQAKHQDHLDQKGWDHSSVCKCV